MAYGRKPSWRSANYRYVAQPGDPPSTEPKPMKARFAGKCEICSGQILPGEDMLWVPATRKARHATCPANPTPVAAIPQIACPKCGQSVYQQTSKYGKPYFTNSTNRQDFHPCRVWTGRRKGSAVSSAIRASSSVNPYPTATTLSAHSTPSGAVPNPIVQAAFDAVQQAEARAEYGDRDPYGDPIVITRADYYDDRTWSTVERDLAEIDKKLASATAETEGITTLVANRVHCLNRLALLTWERIRYDS